MALHPMLKLNVCSRIRSPFHVSSPLREMGEWFYIWNIHVRRQYHGCFAEFSVTDIRSTGMTKMTTNRISLAGDERRLFISKDWLCTYRFGWVWSDTPTSATGLLARGKQNELHTKGRCINIMITCLIQLYHEKSYCDWRDPLRITLVVKYIMESISSFHLVIFRFLYLRLSYLVILHLDCMQFCGALHVTYRPEGTKANREDVTATAVGVNEDERFVCFDGPLPLGNGTYRAVWCLTCSQCIRTIGSWPYSCKTKEKSTWYTCIVYLSIATVC